MRTFIFPFARTGTPRVRGFAGALVLGLLSACGSADPGSGEGDTDASGDGDALTTDALTTDALVDTGTGPDDIQAADGSGTDAAVDADLNDTENPDDVRADVSGNDVRPTDIGRDTQTDPDTTPADVRDAETDAGRVFTPGTLPLPDYIGCDENSDCPNGTGNCITELTLNRTLPDGRIRIPVTDVFSGLARAGVCSLACTTAPDACETPSFRADPTPWTCQVVYVGESAYPGDGSGERPAFPFDDQIAPDAMAAGRPYAALCRPPFQRSTSYAPDFCATCSESELCLPESACIAEQPAAADGATSGTCRVPCEGDSDCPSGFTCDALDGASDVVLSGVNEGSFCRPLLDTCGSCLDADDDGRGIGACLDGTTASAVDCDDRSPIAWYNGMDSLHAFPESCGPDVDSNCNGRADDSEQVGSDAFGQFHCGGCGDVCEGAFANASTSVCVSAGTGTPGICRARCDDPAAFTDCNGLRADGCEVSVADPTRLFVPDCDGDGVGRLNATPIFDCAGDGTFVYPVDGGTCPAVVATLNTTGGYGSDCDDTNINISPLVAERCDGLDNDCNGVTDPSDLFALGTACGDSGVPGVCGATAVRVCDGSGGVRCQAGSPSEEVCDNLDNNCDGVNDNFSASTPTNRIGETCRHSGAAGICGEGRLDCRSGGLQCIPLTPPSLDLPGDGNDADCDGFDGDLQKAIFVRIGGSVGFEGNLGSRENPAGTLERAFQIYYASGRVRNQFFLAAGNYSIPHGINLNFDVDGFSIMGGYDSTGSSWTPGSGRSSISFTSICLCNEVSSPGAGRCDRAECYNPNPAVYVLSPRDVRFQQVSFDVPKQAAGFGHTIGMACYVVDSDTCAGLTLDRVDIRLEGGADGAPAPGTPAASGAAGGLGTIPDVFSSNETRAPGAPSTCGASGGTGGRNETSTPTPCTGGFVRYFAGLPGEAGLPAGRGGAGGTGGQPSTSDCTSPSVNIGGGTGGTIETGPGPGGGGAGVSTSPLQRTQGGIGNTGFSGGGGGGGGGTGALFGVIVSLPGSGGSSGGCGGEPGLGGGPGWSAFGMWIQGANAPNLTAVSIDVGPGGRGADGQAGGAGGLGGAATGGFSLGGSIGGAGGPGGHGTGGSGGGGGGGGWSVGVAREPSLALPLSPRVGAGGAGGSGGAGGAGGRGAIAPIGGTANLVTAISGQNGNAGLVGSSAAFCNLSGGSIGGVPACQ